MKYILRKILLLFFVTAFLPNLALAEYCLIVTTSSTSLNVRSAPTTNSRIIGKAYKGSALRTTGQRENGWTKVKLNNGRVGFVSLDYVFYGECYLVDIKSGNLNIRSLPTIRSRIIGKARRGSALAVLGYKPSWAKVRHNNGKIGYVKKKFLNNHYNYEW